MKILGRLLNITTEDKLALFLVFAGGVLRFYHYAGWSLSNDELSAITRLKFPSFSEMIEQGVRTNDMHPPGVQAFLWLWTKLFGTGEISLRFPFVLLGTLSTGLFYLTGRNLFSRFTALLATACFTALQFPILYSQLARPYSPGLFFSLLMVFALTELIRRSPAFPLKHAVLFITGGVGCMYSHYFSFLFAGLTGMAGFFFITRKNRLTYLTTGIIMVLLFLPAYHVFLTQVGVGGLGGSEGWLGPPGKDALWKYLKYCFNDSYGLLALVVSAGIIFPLLDRLIAGRHAVSFWTSRHTIVLYLFCTPALVAYYYSIWKNPVFQYSILLFSFPYLLLLVFAWCGDRVRHPIHVVQVFAVLLITMVSTVVDKKYYSTHHFARFREVAQQMALYVEKFGTEHTDVTANVIHPDYIHYYADRYSPGMNFLQYICNKEEDYAELNRIVQSSRARFFVHGWANNYNAPETEMIIRSRFPWLAARDSFFNSGVIVFSKDSAAGLIRQMSSLYEVANGFESSSWENDQYFRTDSIAATGNWSLHMRPEFEYSSGIKRTAADLGIQRGVLLELQLSFLSSSALRDAKAVISIERNGQSVLWRGIRLGAFQPDESGQWAPFFMGYRIQEDVLPGDMVAIYCYNPSREEFWLDEFVFRVKP